MTPALVPPPSSPLPTPYRDHKRHAWILSLLVPASTALGPAQ